METESCSVDIQIVHWISSQAVASRSNKLPENIFAPDHYFYVYIAAMLYYFWFWFVAT